MEKETIKFEGHTRTRGQEGAEPEDPVERLLNQTGCLAKHYKVQDCISEFSDWRQCQQEVEDFRICIEEHKKKNPTPKQN